MGLVWQTFLMITLLTDTLISGDDLQYSSNRNKLFPIMGGKIQQTKIIWLKQYQRFADVD